MQNLGSDLTEPSNALAARTILAKRIIEMVDQGLMDVTELGDDAPASKLLTKIKQRRQALAAFAKTEDERLLATSALR